MGRRSFQKAQLQSFSNFLAPPVLPFVFAVLFIPSFNVLSGYFYVLLSLVTVPIARGILAFSKIQPVLRSDWLSYY